MSVAGWAGPATAAAVDWTTDGDGFWDVPTNWSPGLPGATDDVTLDVAGLVTITYRVGATTINSLTSQENLVVSGGSLTVSNAFSNAATTTISGGTLTLNGVSTLASLTQSGGVLAGSGLVTVAGPSSWLAGTHTGSGTTQFDAALAISGNSTKSITGTRSVTLNGTTTWSGNTGNGNNAISLASTASSTIPAASPTPTPLTAASAAVRSTTAAPSTSSRTRRLAIGTVFNNTGTVNVNAGTMLMDGGGTSSGTFNIAAGAKLEFRNGTHTLNNATTSGAGTLADQHRKRRCGCVRHDQRRHAQLGVSAERQHPERHGPGLSGPATWTGGTINGTAAQSTTFAGTLTISGANTKTLSGGRSLNAGNTTWTGNTGNGNNAISSGQAGTFNNTGSFTDANAFDSSITVGGGAHLQQHRRLQQAVEHDDQPRHGVQQHRHGQCECRHAC